MSLRRRFLAPSILLGAIAGAIPGAAGCGEDRIQVHPGENADYNHGPLLTAVDKFVAAGRTPQAYAELSRTALALRPGMDRSVAQEAELKLMVLALAPVQSVRARPMADQVEALAVTVWPTLLAPPIEADDLLTRRDPRAAAMLPAPDEDARSYLIRMCGSQLAGDCKHVVPEQQGPIVDAVATRRATERVRNAVADCVMCGADPGWHEAVRSWEELDRLTNASVAEIQRRADPDNWPVAGNAAESDRRESSAGGGDPDGSAGGAGVRPGGIDPQLPEAEINETGEVVIGGQHYGAAQRVSALRDLRGNGPAIALHLRPETSLAQVRALIADVRKSGADRIAVVARDARYPWDRKIYWIGEGGGGHRTALRPTDSLQLLLHATDAVDTRSVLDAEPSAR
ncbi:MAG: hypothetical protein E6J91_24920 [Deltaproteobacteria bacterium]|nr:MAG: hypothetical protein E6J91_24920 [Deltaproteobacteria bacterium]